MAEDIFSVDLASLEIRLSRSENLSVLPQAVSTILRLADDLNASTREVERAFEQDPAITAKILRVANSAFYGSAHVPTIGRAISLLGLSAVRSLVISVAFQQVSSVKGASRHFERLDYWRHSLATAVACRIIGKLKMPSKSEELYCAGMMHDIGYLVLERFFPEEFDQVVIYAKQTLKPMAAAEKEVLGFDHAEVGAVLARTWNLSPSIWAAIRYHHDPEQDDTWKSTTELVAIANQLAYDGGFLNQNTGRFTPVGPSLLEEIGIPPEQYETILQVIRNEVDRTQAAFQIAA